MRKRDALTTLCWLAVALAAGCQTGEESARADRPAERPRADTAPADGSAYSRDIERICNAELHSGAVEQPVSRRNVIVAQWLGRSLESAKAREFLVTLSRTAKLAKPALLERVAREHGVGRCRLAETWREHAARPDAD